MPERKKSRVSTPARSEKRVIRSKHPRPGKSPKFDDSPLAGRERVLDAFDHLWSDLFASPVHLDSLLSKQAVGVKSILAQIVPVILLKPVSQAEALGVGVAPDEPWSLGIETLRSWRPARQIAERLHGLMQGKVTSARPLELDFPPAMTREWKRDWGEGTARALTEILAEPAPLSLRAARRLGAAAFLEQLKKESRLPVKAELSGFAPLGVRLGGYAAVLGTALFESGGFEIQDEGSQVMALFSLWPALFKDLLSLAPGPVRAPARPLALPAIAPAWTVVDACAGAGGKSMAIADALQGKGRVFAYDTAPKKLQALRRRATRAGFSSIQTVALEQGKEAEVINRFRRRAQVVLVDAPCSGWGVLRRNPDIKWRQSPESIERMPELQLRLLSQYAELVAPGGRLVYGVCTFRMAETRELVARFAQAHPRFRQAEGGYLGPGPCDGFFMQAFTRE